MDDLFSIEEEMWDLIREIAEHDSKNPFVTGRRSLGWQPRAKSAEVLDRAWDLVESVPYQVTSRWLFYRLLQEGYYGKKSDYKNKWSKLVSTARKEFYQGWRPYTLADNTRERVVRGRGDEDVNQWMQDLADRGIDCVLDKWYGQDHYVELWFEARAMTDQFRHYTKYITLVPMAGQPSIPFKWELAKEIETAADRYGLPITILYFGDLDLHGEIISEVVEREVRDWCRSDFEFIRCGLAIDQVQRYNVPENPDKPGEYQWEALSDEGAREIIKGNVDRYLRLDVFDQIDEQEQEVEEFVRDELAGLVERWDDRS